MKIKHSKLRNFKIVTGKHYQNVDELMDILDTVDVAELQNDIIG